MGLKLGTTTIKTLKIGSVGVANAYVGTQLVYSAAIPVDMSLYDENGTARTGGRSTANTYFVKSAGTYMFPVVYGNSIKNGSTNATAYTNNGSSLCHDFVNHLDHQITNPWIENNTGCVPAGVELSVADTANIFSNLNLVTGSDGHKYIRFVVNSVPKTNANGVISVLDSNGVVMWSWFICCRQGGIQTSNYTNHDGISRTISNYALGDLFDETAQTHNKQWYWQWGRTTPQICGAAYNSLENHISYGVKQFAYETVASTIGYAIQHPEMMFIRNDTTNSNWYNEGEGWIGINLWNQAATARNTGGNDNPVKTVYDPSPVGFTAPSGYAFTGFTSTGRSSTTASDWNVIGSFDSGWKFKRTSSDANGSKFWCGYRNRGGRCEIVSPDTELYYWTSTIYNVGNAICLFAKSTQISPSNNRGVAFGSAFRYQKEA